MSGNLQKILNDLIRYAKHLPPGEDHPLEVLVLKWHLLVEEELRSVVRGKFVDPSSYDVQQAKYGTLLRLARALHGPAIAEWEWEVAHQLNVIRNSIAHLLNDDMLIPRIRERLFPLFEKHDKDFARTDADLAERIGYCFAHIHVALLRLKHDEQL